MQTERKTTAERIADLLGNDGMRFETADGREFAELMDAEGATEQHDWAGAEEERAAYRIVEIADEPDLVLELDLDHPRRLRIKRARFMRDLLGLSPDKTYVARDTRTMTYRIPRGADAKQLAADINAGALDAVLDRIQSEDTRLEAGHELEERLTGYAPAWQPEDMGL